MFNKFLSKKRNIFGLEVKDWALLIIGLSVFVVISLWTITKSSIWFDEAFGAYMIRFNFWEIARYTGTDVHPPLYYWLLKCWGMMFGNTELALRSMSVFFGAIAIIFGYLLTNKLFNKNAARISLLFMSLSPMLVRYAQEMRMYTLVAAIALAATYTLVIALESKKKLPWIVYGVLVALGMWTHYFSAIVWIAHWIWQADNVRRVAGKGKFIKEFFSKNWITAYVVAIAVYSAWIPVFLVQSQVVQYFGFWIPAVTPDTLINFLTNVIFYQDVGLVNGWFALGLAAIIILVVYLGIKIYKSMNDKERQNYRLIMAVAFLPVLIIFVLSMPPLRSMFVDRYLVPAVPFIAMFIGITLALGAKFIKIKWRVLGIAIVTVFMVVGVGNVWYYGNYSKTSNASNNTREIFDNVAAKSEAGQPIIADSPWLFYEASFYSTEQHPVYFIDANTSYGFGSLDMLKYNDQSKIKDIKQFTNDHPTVWYMGLPRGGDFSAPYSDWQAIQTIETRDTINGKPSYKAIQYKVEN